MTAKSKLPTIHVTRPACDACGAFKFAVYKSIDQGDGSTMQYATCLSCGEKQKIVWEPPLEFQDMENQREPMSTMRAKETSRS